MNVGACNGEESDACVMMLQRSDDGDEGEDFYLMLPDDGEKNGRHAYAYPL